MITHKNTELVACLQEKQERRERKLINTKIMKGQEKGKMERETKPGENNQKVSQ